jgi:hypothetical protein
MGRVSRDNFPRAVSDPMAAPAFPGAQTKHRGRAGPMNPRLGGEGSPAAPRDHLEQDFTGSRASGLGRLKSPRSSLRAGPASTREKMFFRSGPWGSRVPEAAHSDSRVRLTGRRSASSSARRRFIGKLHDSPPSFQPGTPAGLPC